MKKTTLFLSILLGFAGAAQSQDTDNSYFMLGLQGRMGTMQNAYADANGVVYKDRFSQLGGDFIVESYDNKYFRGDFPFIGDLLFITLENWISKPNKLMGPASGSNRLRQSEGRALPQPTTVAAFAFDEPLVQLIWSALPFKRRIQVGLQGDLRNYGVSYFSVDGEKWEEQSNIGLLAPTNTLLAGGGVNVGYIHYFDAEPLHRLRVSVLYNRYFQRNNRGDNFSNLGSSSLAIESMLYFKRIGYAGLSWHKTTLNEAFEVNSIMQTTSSGMLRIKFGVFIRNK